MEIGFCIIAAAVILFLGVPYGAYQDWMKPKEK